MPTTASDDTARAAAVNSAATMRSVSGPTNESGIVSPTASPPARGTTTLPAVTNAVARPSDRINPRSVSKPVVTSNSAMPTQPTARSIPPWTRSYRQEPLEAGRPDPAEDRRAEHDARRAAPTTDGSPTRQTGAAEQACDDDQSEQLELQKTSSWCSSSEISTPVPGADPHW
ncbi:MAG: hypothetical protein U5R31_12960 [Acidimicrobiia bacterium]|nr:hypothetical protein [Acidimicrobiia bacterium]